MSPFSIYRKSSNELLHISGQLPLEKITGNVSQGSIYEQTKLALQGVGQVLVENGLTPKDVVKTNVFTTDISKITEINQAYCEFFNGNMPARSAFEVAGLSKGAKIEIDAIADFN